MLARISKGTVVVLEAMTGASVLAIAAILTLEVISRYLLEYPFSWPEELCGFVFVWLIFLGAPLSYRSGQLIGIRIFVEMLPKTAQRTVAVAINIVVVAFLVYLAYQGVEATISAWNKKTTVLEFSWAWIYLALPIGALAMTVGYLATVVRLFRERHGDSRSPSHSN